MAYNILNQNFNYVLRNRLIKTDSVKFFNNMMHTNVDDEAFRLKQETTT